MKKLLLLASGALLCFTGCYKEKEKISVPDALVSTVWKIQAHVTAKSLEPGVDCRLAQLLVYNKDSTGYYYFPGKCDSTDADTLHFRWRVSGDSKNLYLTHIGGVASVTAILGISYYDETVLRTRGGAYTPRLLDGYFMALPKE